MNKYTQFLNKCELIDYNSSKKDICEELLKDKVAKKICRDLIHDDCIEDILKSNEIKGYIAIANGEYIGFIFFKINYDTYYLSLIATKPKLGFPLGQILLTKMEEEGRINKAYNLQADAIPEAIHFYEKMNYEIKYQDEKTKEYLIEKKL